MRKNVWLAAAALTVLLAGCGGAETSVPKAEAPAAEEAAAEEAAVEEETAAEEEAAEEAAAPEETAEAAEEALPDRRAELAENSNAAAQVTAEEGTITTPYFAVTLPEGWKDSCEWYANEDESGFTLALYDTKTLDAGDGGWLTTVQMTKEVPMHILYVNGSFVDGIKKAGTEEVCGYLSTASPTDVQFGPDTQEGYMALYETADDMQIVPAADYEACGMTYADALSDVEQTIEGYVIDAAMHSFVLQTSSGPIYISGAGVSSAALGIEPGHSYELTYTGLINTEDNSTEQVSVVKAENTDEGKPEKDPGAAMLAGEAILAFDAKNTDYLADLCRYPLTVDGETIESEKDLEAMEFDELIKDPLYRMIRYDNLAEEELTGESIQFSMVPDYCHLTLEKDGDLWVITEIVNAEE